MLPCRHAFRRYIRCRVEAADTTLPFAVAATLLLFRYAVIITRRFTPFRYADINAILATIPLVHIPYYASSAMLLYAIAFFVATPDAAISFIFAADLLSRHIPVTLHLLPLFR